MRLFVCTLIFTILICSAAYGSDTRQTQFFFAEQGIVADKQEKTCYLFFSEIEFTNECKSDIVIVGGTVTFSGGAAGKVYALFAKVEASGELDIVQITSVTHFFLLVSLAQLVLSTVVLLLNVRRQQQQATVAEKEWKQAAITGGYVFFAFISLIVIFVLSVVGIPVAVVLLLVALVLYFLGQIPVCMAAGFLISRRVHKKMHFFVYFLIGYGVVEVCKYIPLVGILVRFVAVPVISFGCLSRAFVNQYITKRYYTTRFYEPLQKDAPKRRLPGYDILHDKSEPSRSLE